MGHIMVDYRICAAMLNFVHKPVTADGQNARKVAVRIHRQVATSAAQNNPLSFLLNKRLDTKLIKRQNLSEINDFPRLVSAINNVKDFS